MCIMSINDDKKTFFTILADIIILRAYVHYTLDLLYLGTMFPYDNACYTVLFTQRPYYC